MTAHCSSPFTALLVALVCILSAAVLAAMIARPKNEVPGVSLVQESYDREAGRGNTKHDPNLRIIDANCKIRPDAQSFLCFVAFTDRLDADSRLYYDIAEIAPEDGGWRLKSGICKR